MTVPSCIGFSIAEPERHACSPKSDRCDVADLSEAADTYELTATDVRPLIAQL